MKIELRDFHNNTLRTLRLGNAKRWFRRSRHEKKMINKRDIVFRMGGKEGVVTHFACVSSEGIAFVGSLNAPILVGPRIQPRFPEGCLDVTL